MKTRSIKISKRGRLSVSAGTVRRCLKRMEDVATEAADMTGVKRNEGDTPVRCTQIAKMVDYLKERYAFRYNCVKGCTEFKARNEDTVFEALDTRAINRITLEVQLAGMAVGNNDVRNFVESDLLESYDPVGDFLSSCEGRWDGTDHIGRLADRVPTDDAAWRGNFHTWFLGMVAQWSGKTGAMHGNSYVPLLISDQGFNKSTFCRIILPPRLRWGLCDSLQLQEKKQVLRAMTELLLINLDEFNQISAKLQQGFLKNIVQLPAVKTKRPYAAHIEEIPRRASFIATSNMQNVLSDPSGSRRFICVDIKEPIDVASGINYTQLYAQALAEIEGGRRWYMDRRETERLVRANARFQCTMPAEDFFYEYFRMGKENDDMACFMTTAAIYGILKKKAGAAVTQTNLTTFSRRLKALPGMVCKRTCRGNEFLVEVIKE